MCTAAICAYILDGVDSPSQGHGDSPATWNNNNGRDYFKTRFAFMTAIVRLALARPYTFVVMAILIMIFGVMSAIRTPTDIFPNIGIPVISVVWSYTGLPPDDMSGRIVARLRTRAVHHGQ